MNRGMRPPSMRTEPRSLAIIRNGDGFVVAALGAVEIISYGTLYYCVSVVADDIARDLEITCEWIFGCFSLALFASALMSLIAGRLMDRYGADRTMKLATFAAAVSLGLAAVSWNAVVFAIALFGMQIAATFLFYEAGLALLVQRDAGNAKRQMTLLTLIVGFSSTLFWPLTSLLLTLVSWRGVFGIYAGINVFIALPLTMCTIRRRSVGPADENDVNELQVSSNASPQVFDFALITIGFSLAAFVLSALLGNMISILSSIGLGLEGALFSALFGPSQILIRLLAAFTGNVAAIQLTLLSCILLCSATVIVALTSHSVLGVTAFLVLLGFSSGLNSICRGTLPLWMFGQVGYGSRVGLVSAFRLSTASFAPLLFSVVQNRYGISVALISLSICAAGSMLAFMLVSIRIKRHPSNFNE